MALEGLTTIDIPLLKIVDWLAERRFLRPQWRAKNKAVQQKAEELSHKLSEELREYRGLTEYFAAKRLRDSLIQGAEKNLLGYYKGEAGVWDRLVRAYELENIHIGETALRLIRNGEYEIPYLQTLISKHQQQLADFEKKESEYGRMAINAQKTHIQECAALGIEGNDIAEDLLVLTRQLPQLMYEAARQLQTDSVREAGQYYADFTSHVNPSTAELSAQDLLPTIAGIQRATLNAPEQDEAAGCPSRADQLDGEESRGQNDAALQGEVDWDFETDDGAGQNGDAGDIDWDVEIDEGVADQATAPVEISTPIAPGDEGDTVTQLVEDQKFRAAVVVELAELCAFLGQRSTELSAGYQSILAAALPPILQQVSLSSVQDMERQVTACRTAFSSDRVAMLTALKTTSSQYFKRTCAALTQQASQESKFYRLQRELQSKRQELQAKLVEDAAKLASIIAETKEFKSFVEEGISGLTKGASVHITGDINNTLMK